MCAISPFAPRTAIGTRHHLQSYRRAQRLRWTDMPRLGQHARGRCGGEALFGKREE